MPDNLPKRPKKNFMAPFYRWGSTASRLQSHYEEEIYFSSLNSINLKTKSLNSINFSVNDIAKIVSYLNPNKVKPI